MKYYDKPEVWNREVQELTKQLTGQTRKALTTVGFSTKQAEELEPIINVWVLTYLSQYMVTDVKATVKSDNEDSAEEADRSMERALKNVRESRTSLSNAMATWLRYQSFLSEEWADARTRGSSDECEPIALMRLQSLMYAQAAESAPFR